MRKGQIFTWDLVLGLMIFLVATYITMWLWETSYLELRQAEDGYEMNWLVETVSDQLVRTPGDPYNWGTDNAVTYGLAESVGGGREVTGRVLDADKILRLVDAFSLDYAKARDKLFGSSRYNLYIELSCVNRSDLSCLGGLQLDEVNSPVYCNNKRIGVTSRVTDTYLWLEAENLWGRYDDNSCEKGCSGNNMSLITAGTPDVKVKTNPGTYQVWVRTVEDRSQAKLLINGIEHPMYKIGVPGLIGWNWVGEQELPEEATINFKDASGNLVDAILLTTDIFYNPGWENSRTYGNPNTESKCVIGNYREGADIISSSKTAVIGTPRSFTETFMGAQPMNDRVLEVNVVAWRGVALPPREITPGGTTTTTTTNPPTRITCTGSPDENCLSNNPPVIDIQGAALYDSVGVNNTIVCGAEKNITVQWRGRHAGDPNYFAFYIDDRNNYMDSCQSDNTAYEEGSTLYDYQMNCTLNVPDRSALTIPDGEHELVMTGEDYGGYCKAGDTRADDEYKVAVNISDCVNYNPLTCTPTTSVKLACNGGANTVEKVYSVSAADNEIVCNQLNRITVRWGGTHGTDNATYWTYVLKRGGEYLCIWTCNSTVDPEDGPEREYYEMTCDMTPNNKNCLGADYAIEGQYDLYVVAETDRGEYCNNPESINAEAVGKTTVNVICPQPPEEPEVAIGNFGIAGPSPPDDFDKMKEIGVELVRGRTQWDEVEKTNDNFDFTVHDEGYDRFTETYGFQPIVRFETGAGWGTTCSSGCDTTKASYPPKNVVEWGTQGYYPDVYDFVNKTLWHQFDIDGTVGKVRPITHIIVGNEIDLDQFWGGTTEEYTKLRATVYQAVKDFNAEHGKSVKVVDNGLADYVFAHSTTCLIFDEEGATAACQYADKQYRYDPDKYPRPCRGTESWADYCLPENDPVMKIAETDLSVDPNLGEPSFDYLGYHYYFSWDAQEKYIWGMNQAMSRMEYSRPIMNTEGGIMDSTTAFDDPEVRRVAAEDLVKYHVVAFANGVKTFLWLPFTERDDTLAGLVSAAPDLIELPTYHSYNTTTHKLKGFTSAEKLTSFTTADVYKFTKPGGAVYVLWNETPTPPVDLSGELPGNVKITGIDGSFATVPSSAIGVTQSPIFVESCAGLDIDGDGYVNIACGGGDCDDYNPDTYPGAPEICDGYDNQCPGDGLADEGCESYPFGFAGLYRAQDFVAAEELGTGYSRPESSWDSIETSDNTFVFSSVDNAYDSLKSYGLEPVISLRAKQGWGTYCDTVNIKCPASYDTCPWKWASCPPRDLSDTFGPHGYSELYYDFIYKVLTHMFNVDGLADKERPIEYIIVENEVNTLIFWHGTAEDYLKTRATAYKAVKDFNLKYGEKVKVVDNGIASGVWGYAITLEQYCAGDVSQALDFANRFYRRSTTETITEYILTQTIDCTNPETKDRGRDYLIMKDVFKKDPNMGVTFDYMSYHFYAPWETQEEIIEWMKTEMQKNGYQRPVMHSEGGYVDTLRFYDDPDLTAVEKLKQDVADDVVKNHVIAFADGVVMWTWLPVFENYDESGSLGPQYKGLYTPDGEQLPSFTSYKVMVEKINGFTRAEKLDGYTAEVYKFTKPGGVVYVLWNETPTPPVDLSGEIQENVKITNIDGTTTTADSASIDMTGNPIYVEETTEPLPTFSCDEMDVLADPDVKGVLDGIFNPYMVYADGSVGYNYPSYQYVSNQRGAKYVVLQGISDGIGDRISNGTGAFNYGFWHQNNDGSFQTTVGNPWDANMLSSEAFFMAAFSHSALAVNCSQFANTHYVNYTNRIGNVTNALTYLYDKKDILDSYDSGAPNRLAFDAIAYKLNGYLIDNADARRIGDEYWSYALTLRDSSGYFVEGGGFDSSYQATNILNFEILYLYNTNATQRSMLRPVIDSAVEWEKARVQPSGRVDTTGNTRTCDPELSCCYDTTNPDPNLKCCGGEELHGCKVTNYPEIITSLIYWAAMDGDSEARQKALQAKDHAFRKPAAPTNLVATYDSSPTPHVDLSWTDSADNEFVYIIGRREKTVTPPGSWGSWIQIGTIASEAGPVYADNNIVTNRVYQYAVQASNYVQSDPTTSNSITLP